MDSKVVLKEMLENKNISSKEVLEITLEYIKDYEKSILKERNSLIWNACNFNIQFILDSKKFQKMQTEQKISFLIDMLFYLKPIGCDSSTIAIEQAIELFIECCKEVDILNNETYVDWLKNIKGFEHYEWVEWVLSVKTKGGTR